MIRELYHGSVTPNIKVLKPKKRFTPQGIRRKAVYAGLTPAYATAHAIPWTTKEGFKLGIEIGKVLFEIPEEHAHRLNQRIHIYTVSAEQFELMDTEPEGYNFHSYKEVNVLRINSFKNVNLAMRKYGGVIKII